MNIKVEKLPHSRVKLAIEVSKDQVGKFFDEAYKKLAPSVNIKGFRAGRAPKILVLEAVGQNRYNSEALNLAIPQSYFQAVSQEKLIPITQPAVAIKQFKEGDDFLYDAEVDVMPEIKIGDYKSVKIKNQSSKIKYEASEKEIDIIIKRLRYQDAKFNDVAREAKIDDRVEINFEGYENKVKLENFTSNNYPLILGEGVLVKGFEENLIGMKKDDEKEFSLKVPSQTKGGKDKKIDFKVKINNIKEVVLSELGAEFAKKFGHNSIESLRKAIGENIIKEKQMKDTMRLEQEVLEKLAAKTVVDLPLCLIEQEVSRKITELQQRVGPSFTSFLEKSGKTINDLRKDLAPQAEKTVKIGLMLGELAKEFGLAKNKPKDEQEQKEIVRKTVDKLIEFATK